MTLKKEWAARCDHPDCPATEVFPGSWDKWEAGLALNDKGWQASPGNSETYCRDHWVSPWPPRDLVEETD